MRINKLLSFLILFSLPAALLAQPKLGPAAEISVLTADPGAEIYTSFGHSAIRIVDPTLNMDAVYNYGMFSFNQPGFYGKFMRGKLDYMLGAYGYQGFHQTYVAENRSIYEQVLNLTQEEKQAIFEFLLENYKPENRYYKYDFFFDNCATRVRDVIDDALGDNAQYDYSKYKEPNSFREILDPYVEHLPWVKFGFYLILGLPSDEIADPYDYMYIPEHMMIIYEGSQINREGQLQPLVSETNVLFKSEPKEPSILAFKPWMLTVGILVIVLFWTAFGFSTGRNMRLLDFILFMLMGLLGVFWLLCWFGTDHQVLPWNMNMIWCFPAHVVMVFFLWRKPIPFWLKRYFLIYAIALVILLLSWPWFPQNLSETVIPLIIALIVRAVAVYFYRLDFKDEPSVETSSTSAEAAAGA